MQLPPTSPEPPVLPPPLEGPNVANLQEASANEPRAGGAGPAAGGPYRGPVPSLTAPARRVPLRSIIAGVLALGTVSAVGAHYALKAPPPKAARALGARLDLAAGDVVVSDASGSDGSPRALSGTPLATGATITTKKGARALVRTSD